jgi:uncharacterized protein DUF1360
MASSHAFDPTTGYSDHEHRPLAGYSALTTLFGTAFVTGLVAASKHRGELPERYSPWDLLTVGVATHKLSRLITKDRVTSFVRAPFVRYQEPDGHGEVSEEARGSGLRLATGELLICPYCIAQWVVAALGVGMVAAPRLTRLIAFMYTAQAASDFLQLAYLAAEDAAAS